MLQLRRAVVRSWRELDPSILTPLFQRLPGVRARVVLKGGGTADGPHPLGLGPTLTTQTVCDPFQCSTLCVFYASCVAKLVFLTLELFAADLSEFRALYFVA